MKKYLILFLFMGLVSVAYAQYYGDGYYYNSSINGMNMSQHMINTYQNMNNWNNYLYQMQMQQMQQMHQNGLMYNTKTDNKKKENQKKQKCSECSGTGKIKSYYKVNGEMRVSKRTCSYCKGTGRSKY